MVNFLGTYGGLICGFGGFLTAIAACLYARACCGVRTERARSGLATSIGAEFRRSQTKKSVSKVAEQHERARSRVIEKFKRAGFDAKFDAAEWQRAADKKG